MQVHRRNRRSLAMLMSIAVGMCAAAYASVPFYDWFCRVTGFGGTTAVGTISMPSTEIDRIIKVRFDASLDRDMPWEFRPELRVIEAQIGEPVLAYYVAHNPSRKAITGTASYNVHPFAAGGHFVKVDCFCFEEQTLQPGETVRMPVSFFVDPSLLDDPELPDLQTVTLSYTFHLSEPEPLAASGLSDGSAKLVTTHPEGFLHHRIAQIIRQES